MIDVWWHQLCCTHMHTMFLIFVNVTFFPHHSQPQELDWQGLTQSASWSFESGWLLYIRLLLSRSKKKKDLVLDFRRSLLKKKIICVQLFHTIVMLLVLGSSHNRWPLGGGLDIDCFWLEACTESFSFLLWSRTKKICSISQVKTCLQLSAAL